MQCEEAELATSALFDRDLGRARELFLHLAACCECRELLAQMLLLRAMCRVAQQAWERE
jgi:hypothetical protein